MIIAQQPHREASVKFGHRRIPPRVCVVANQPHVRSFLADMLEEVGFITHQCAGPDIQRALHGFWPDLVVLGPLNGETEVRASLVILKSKSYRGRVMLFGGRSSPALIRAHEYGEQVNLAMLPPLGTPFRDSDMLENLSNFLPVVPSPSLPADADEVLQNGWLELWYQPKINPRSLVPGGAEALIRVRHPTWGVVAPAYFIPGANDPYFEALSQFVLMRAMADRIGFTLANRPVDVSVNLPWPALADGRFIDRVMQTLPAGWQSGFSIEVDCADMIGDIDLVRQIAAQLASRDIGIVVDDIGAESISLAGRRDLPLVEMKVAPKFVRGCADDRIKQAVCAGVVAAARETGARSVAQGVETQADFAMVRELGFDLLQGMMFAKPMEPRKFERAILSRKHAPAE